MYEPGPVEEVVDDVRLEDSHPLPVRHLLGILLNLTTTQEQSMQTFCKTLSCGSEIRKRDEGIPDPVLFKAVINKFF